MLRQIYNRLSGGVSTKLYGGLSERVLALCAHRHAVRWLAGVSFIESSIFPIPPDVMLVPMVLADRTHAWRNAWVCTLASVLGGVAGYVIGFYFWNAIGQPIISFYGGDAAFDKFTSFYAQWGIWVVLAAAISFLPYKIATIASGVAGLAFIPFIVTSLIGRGIRFFAVAGLIYFFGPQASRLIDRYFNILSIGVLVALAVLLGFVLLGGGPA